MNVKRRHIRSVIISLFIVLISFWNFYRSGETDCVKVVQIVSLLVCGMAIGILLKSLVGWIRD